MHCTLYRVPSSEGDVVSTGEGKELVVRYKLYLSPHLRSASFQQTYNGAKGKKWSRRRRD